VAESRLIDTVLGTVRVQVSGNGEAMMFWPSLLMIEEFVFRG
jgi:3-oxoadipate enol-lactonase